MSENNRERQAPSFMAKATALKDEHKLCVLRDGATRALYAFAHEGHVIISCLRCHASWTLRITEDDAEELDKYVHGRRDEKPNEDTPPDGDGA
jgi:hypothetical protein